MREHDMIFEIFLIKNLETLNKFYYRISKVSK